METNDRDTNFEIPMNVAGLTPAEGGVAAPEGYYKTKITACYRKPDNQGRVIFTMEVAEGPSQGAKMVTGLNIPKSTEDNVRYYWRAALESVGYTAAQLDAGDIKLGPPAFVGRAAHIYFKPKDESNQYDELKWLSPGTWEERRATFVPSAPPASAPKVAAAPAISAAQTLAGPPSLGALTQPAATAQGANNLANAQMLSALGLPASGLN